MNFDVRRMVLPYSPCRTCHSTATTMLFCILLLTTTPTFSDFCDIFSPALGPHPQRELTPMPRLGFSGLGSARHPSAAAAPGAPAWPQALLRPLLPDERFHS